jgi:zinc transporter
MRLCADWLFWVRLLRNGDLEYSHRMLNRWRINSSNARTRPPGDLEWREGRRVLMSDQGMHLREAADRITRISEELDSIRDRAAVLQDQLAGQRQEQLNRRLLTLSIISAFFLPMTFFTGQLGMNHAGIPFHDQDWSFGAVVGATVVISGGLLGLLKWKSWI